MSDLLRFRDDELTKYLRRIELAVIRETAPLNDLRLLEPAAPRFDPPPDDGAWAPIAVGGQWGAKQQWAYFRATAEVPKHWTKGAIDLRMGHEAHNIAGSLDDDYPAGPEGQLFIGGERVGAIDRRHMRVRHAFKPGSSFDVRAVFFAARCECRHTLSAFQIEWIDTAAEKLWNDLRVALDMATSLDECSIAREKLFAAVNSAIRAIDLREPGSAAFRNSIRAGQETFDAAISKLDSSSDAPNVVCIGHAHIDLGWLWPIKQTHHKCVRTFATQCRLLDQYGGWVFLNSSPQAYAWVEKDAPDLFEKIRFLIDSGRWEADGASWIEMDTTLPSGESLVRQLLYGKRFFRDKLGVDSRLMWLPDVFGFTGALPQLMKLAGVDKFVTSKISWSQYNRFPFETFRWRGIDGSEIVTHFINTPGESWRPGDKEWIRTYVSMMTVRETLAAWQATQQRELMISPLLTFGYGDGGGGPTEEMLETAERMAYMPAVGTLPKVKFERASALLDRIRVQAERLPVWDGELYLEAHQGTYTTQAWIKRANRKNEVRLHNAEWLATVAAHQGFTPDKPTFDLLWQDLLLLQFHDILPGSSVGELYDEVRPMHAAIAERANGIVGDAADVIARKIDTKGAKKPAVLFNTLSWDRNDPIRLPDGSWRDDVSVPAGGWKVIDLAQPPAKSDSVIDISDDGRLMSNRFWTLRFDECGSISDLHDKRRRRHILPEGAVANEWQLFSDWPPNLDAWEIYRYYQNHPLPGPTLVSIRRAEIQEARAAVELEWRLKERSDGRSGSITQRIVLYSNSPRIDFETQIDWVEDHQLLKVAFPVAVRATEAAYEIQFGHIRRPTHVNTSWDLAKYEVPAQRFVDLGEHGYGVALLNDCKYGHDVRDGVLRLTCIKSATSPNAQADKCRHEFTYSLLPHAGSFQEAGVIRAAAELNNPVIVREMQPASGTLPAEFRLVECDQPAVIVDTIKPAEDGAGIIVRLYESFGSRCRATITLALPVKSVELVSLLEEPMKNDVELAHKESTISLSVRPFQIVSLRVRT